MSTPIITDVLLSPELPADPAAPVAGVKTYAKDVVGTTQLFARTPDGTVHQLTPTSGGPSNLVVWTVAKTWAQVYTEIQALTGPVIVLVEWDPAGSRVMTNNGGAPTELWNVQFVALVDFFAPNNQPRQVQIETDEGFVLGIDPDTGYAVLLSKNIWWNFLTATGPIVPLDTPVYFQLDGGSFTYNATGYVIETDVFQAVFSNGAFIDGAAGGPGMIRLTGDNSSIVCHDGVILNDNVWVTTTGAKTIAVQLDPTVNISNAPFGPGVTPVYTGSRVFLISPNGVQWTGTIDNAGVVTWA